MRKNYVWLVIIAVAVMALWLTRSNPSVTSTPTPTPVPTNTESVPGTTKVPGAANYQELLQQYAGKRIEFGMNCEASPSNLSVKNGTKIMLDNRSSERRAVKVGTQSYSIVGYGYQLVILTSVTLPTTLSVDCGSTANVGKIEIQK